MATMTVSFPDAITDWMKTLTERGEFASSADYLRDLVLRDRQNRAEELSLEELRQIVDDSRAGGVSSRTTADILSQAKQIVHARQMKRG